MTVSCDSIEIFNVSSTGYAIRVKGLRSSNGISGLQVPTWSEESGQDDLVWYDALKWGDDWYCTINSVDHNSDSGTYQSHFYVVTSSGSKEYLDGKKITVPERPVGLAKKAGYAIYWWPSFLDRRWDKLNRTTASRRVIHDPYSPRGNKIVHGEIKQAVNSIHELEFSIPLDHTMYQKMVQFKSIIEVVNLRDNEIEFVGRVLTMTNEMSTNGFVQKVVCEDFLSYLHDSAQWFQKLPNKGAEDYLKIIFDSANVQIEEFKRITPRNITVHSKSDRPFRYIGYDSSWDTVRERIINNIGGYLTLREFNTRLYADWTKDIGVTKESPIKLGQNIKSASREVDFDGLATIIVPVGADLQIQNQGQEEDQSPDVTRAQLDIRSVNDGKMYLADEELIKEFGFIRKSVIWTEIDNPSILLARGKQYLRNQKIALAKWTISAVERYLIDSRYSKFRIGNKHKIINAPLSGIETLQILEKKIDILNPQSVDLTIGSQSQSLSAYQLQTQEADSSIEKLKLDQSIATKQKKLEQLNAQLAALRSASQSKPVEPKAPTAPGANATEAERTAYNQALADYNVAKADYDAKLSAFNMSQQERAQRISELEAEIARLRNELGGA
ncbi:MAG: GBS Bsp-like repeat-containing protein [Streptococcus sp.]|uniref:GBS Bsp-like repeat-containing protein n=1 Tax=Streptococcus sp. TaxID=1306 RepID=UPI00399640B7